MEKLRSAGPDLVVERRWVGWFLRVWGPETTTTTTTTTITITITTYLL